MSNDAQQSTARRDELLAIEAKVQAAWEDAKVFESDAPTGDAEKKEHFFVTFPYPYMNGILHIGHAFSMSKCEFAARYQRLLGKNVLWPFAFHCTGMPIAACADKLKYEVANFMKDGKMEFPVEVEEENKEESENKAPAAAAPGKKRKKKGKIAKKKSKAKYQWQIMMEMGVPESEISQFQDPHHWLQYFPPIGKDHLKKIGVACDFRRSFITTAINPYYDRFIEWHFNTLKRRGAIGFGNRLSIFSPVTDQPCADHDRASGEGVGPQEYTLIKLRLVDDAFPEELAEFKGKCDVILPAATLRPETMYGQTNLWLLPTGKYGIYRISEKEVFVCSDRSALNMSYQNLTPVRGKPEKIGSILGEKLLGKAVSGPLTSYEKMYILPLLTISMDKGTGVVTSVPSDAPDDYAALMDMKNKEAFRAKYGITDEMVLPFEVIPIIDIEGLGTAAAARLCDERKVQSQNDAKKLALIKEEVYTQGFYKGKLIVGPHAGEKVDIIKPIIKQELIDSGDALAYSEPESRVVARGGEECVVALADQWYLKYGEDEWKAKVEEHVAERLETYNPAAKKKFTETVAWLREWACSRTYGLGTALPWDKKWVIESLSDSTIYMAYYTIAHLIQGGGLAGDQAGTLGLEAQALTDDVFNYVFLNKEFPAYPEGCGIPQEKLDAMRTEFEYWYPMSLRCSGKDLIGNHLTMSIYNHAAVWKDQPEMWPQSFFTNGHIMINKEKMSKSTGNFFTLNELVESFSADATRLSLAEAGDGLNDANFDKDMVNANILVLTKEKTWLEKVGEETLREGPPSTFLDRVFENEINKLVADCKVAYDEMRFHDALKSGFWEMRNARDKYREYEKEGMNAQLVQKWMEAFLVMLSPICPHLTEHLWTVAAKKEGFICQASWPEVAAEDTDLSQSYAYLNAFNKNLQSVYTKQSSRKPKKGQPEQKPLTGAYIFVAKTLSAEKSFVADRMKEDWEASEGKSFTDPKQLVKDLSAKGLLKSKKDSAKYMQFAALLRRNVETNGVAGFNFTTPFDEKEVLEANLAFAQRGAGTEDLKVQVFDVEDEARPVKDITADPNEPAIYLYSEE